jgi:hypothetical protein
VTPQQADAYAEKVLAVVNTAERSTLDSGSFYSRFTDDRERVHSALRALHRAEEGLEQHAFYRADGVTCDSECDVCARGDGHVIDACDWCHDWEGGVYAWPCPDARRYAEARDDALDDLRRIGRLYGISE